MCNVMKMESTVLMKSLEFSHNTQSWQHLHFCIASNENKMEIDKSWIKSNTKRNWSWYIELKLMRWITVSNLFPDLGNSKMATMPNLCNILENSNQWPTWIRRWIEFIGGSRITHWRGCQPCWAGTNIRFCQIFLTTAWNWENFWP